MFNYFPLQLTKIANLKLKTNLTMNMSRHKLNEDIKHIHIVCMNPITPKTLQYRRSKSELELKYRKKLPMIYGNFVFALHTPEEFS